MNHNVKNGVISPLFKNIPFLRSLFCFHDYTAMYHNYAKISVHNAVLISTQRNSIYSMTKELNSFFKSPITCNRFKTDGKHLSVMITYRMEESKKN